MPALLVLLIDSPQVATPTEPAIRERARRAIKKRAHAHPGAAKGSWASPFWKAPEDTVCIGVVSEIIEVHIRNP